ncbi:MAG TPA: sugar phosphate isomerase/epimerase family protein [Agromyces sp.]|nr:sugar phosphate isomerase/epimerase family protein [Agromyces sp.]
MQEHLAEEWPIATCLLGVSPIGRDGVAVQDAPAETWAAIFQDVAAEGFRLAELTDGVIRPADLSLERRRELVDVAREQGVGIPAVHVQRASVAIPGSEAENLAYAHRSIDATAELGATVYSTGLHGPFTEAQRRALWFWTAQGHIDADDADQRARAVRAIRELGTHAASVGLIVSLELYEDTWLGTAAGAVRFIEDVGLDNVGLNPDVGNLVRLHRPVEDWRELYATTLPYANYWHLKNYARDEAADGSWQTAVPTTLDAGVIDYRWAVREAVALGYRGLFTCEHYGGDSLAMCGRAQEYLRRVLPKAIPARNELAPTGAERN